MVRALASPREFSKADFGIVSERSDGVPLYVEEVARVLLERGGQACLEAIPPGLHQSLAARLDRLGEAREIAEIGAVLGRVFDYALLRDAADLPEAALRASLERLSQADILVARGVPPDSAYRFKHALIRDAAYENLLMSRRQALHLRAAELLRDPERVIPEPDSIARNIAGADKAGQELDEDADDRTATGSAR